MKIDLLLMDGKTRTHDIAGFRLPEDDGKPSHLKCIATGGFADDAWGHGTTNGHVILQLDTMDYKSGNVWMDLEQAEHLVSQMQEAMEEARKAHGKKSPQDDVVAHLTDDEAELHDQGESDGLWRLVEELRDRIGPDAMHAVWKTWEEADALGCGGFWDVFGQLALTQTADADS